MGILNRLWTKIWNDEDNAKRLAFEQEMAAAHIAASDKMACLTDKQKIIDKYGGIESSMYDNIQHMNNRTFLQQQLQQQQQLYQAQVLQNHMATNVYPQTIYAGSVTGTSVYAGSGTGMSAPSTTVWPTAQGATFPWLGNPDRDRFFLALRGVEEDSMKRQDGNHDYDDWAASILDMRKLNPQEIGLLELASFCLSNLMEVEPILMLLEGYGMKVVP